MKVKRMDMIRNENIRGTADVRCFGDKVREVRLRCFGDGQRWKDAEVELPGRRPKGRPKRDRWISVSECKVSWCERSE